MPSVGNVAQDMESIGGGNIENAAAVHAIGGVQDDTDTPNGARIPDLEVYPGLQGAEQLSMDADANFGDSDSPLEPDNVVHASDPSFNMGDGEAAILIDGGPIDFEADADEEEFTRYSDDDEDVLVASETHPHPKPNAGQANANPMKRGGPGKPRSAMPTWLRQHYQSTCDQIKQEIEQNPSGKPSCYASGQFYISPGAPIFRNASSTPQPIQFYTPTYFVWLPHLLVKRIPCPACLSAGRKRKNGSEAMLALHSWPRMPRRVVDLEFNIFIIGHRYYCSNEGCGHTYQSWSKAILDILPKSVSLYFTHHLTFRSGLTDRLVAVLRSSFQRGLGPSPFAEMIRTFHIRYYEKCHIQYLEMVKLCSQFTLAGFTPKHKPFGKWADTDGYAGFVPSYTYFRGFYDAMIEKHAAEIDQHMAMLPARIICIDHSHKVIFQRFVQKH
jgi:hypothetical protein